TLASSLALAAEDWPTFHAQATSSLQGKMYMVLIDSAGRQILNTFVPYGQAPPQTADPDILKAVLRSKAPVVSDLFMSQVAKVPVYALAVPILRDGEVRYVMVLGLQPDTLESIVQAQNLQAPFQATIWDSKGNVVASSHQSRSLGGHPVPVELRAR